VAQVALTGADLPDVHTPLPGPRTAELVEVLAATECPALTARRARREERSGAPQDPIVWAEARGSNVLDADGNRYVDLTAGFGVMALGHCHDAITAAVSKQARTLVHGLGDVYPSNTKVELLETLRRIVPVKNARIMLGLSGADAVEAALKTALLHTKKPGILAFSGGYHGLSQGPLAVCGYQESFRAPFREHLHPHARFVPYPRDGRDDLSDALAAVERALIRSDVPIGAVVIEPIQSRGGVVVPPPGFLRGVSELARAHGALLVVDEIYTGFGRTGVRWCVENEGVEPDVLCLGKALGGGFPISACVAREEVMRAWGDPGGEAIHTGTFFGHPVACAASLAALRAMDEERTTERALEMGASLRGSLQFAVGGHPAVHEIRGHGLLVGIEFDSGERTLGLVRKLLERGYITLPAGPRAEVLSITPPLNISHSLLEEFVTTLAECLP
jgi:4-aminobutyrate aminotransferase/(S)-3-amino-2-methylpropionate transaminase